MNVQRHISEHGWDSLETLGIKVKIYKEGIAKLNYDQIKSPKTNPVVMECRALILSYPEAEPVSRAFLRFFNHGEAKEITEKCNLNNADFYEKADGSLIQMYFCPQTNRWEIATRSMAFAEGPKNQDKNETFRSAVLNAMGLDNEEEFQKFCQILEPKYTYVFEYCGPSNRIVTKYSEDHLVLLSIVQNDSGEELIHMINDHCTKFKGLKLNIRTPVLYSISDEKQMKSIIESFEGLEEGFVVRDRITGVRVKVKSPKYVTFHHIKSNDNLPKRFAELVITNEMDEYLSVIPEDGDILNKYNDAWMFIRKELSEKWDSVKDIESQRDFALAIKNFKFSRYLFNARKNKNNPLNELDLSDLDHKCELILSNI